MTSDLRTTLRNQRRRRRLRFWAGFVLIALVGGLWAGLTEDPVGPGLFDDQLVGAEPAEAPAFEVAPEPVQTTMVATVPPTATGPDGSTSTSGAPTPTTAGLDTSTTAPAGLSTTVGP